MRTDGSIWFSDPDFGITSDYEGHRAESEIGACNVYRADPATGEVRLVADGFGGPYAPDGTLIGRIRVPEPVSNITFGGAKSNRLFITATTGLYSAVTSVTGLPRTPQVIED
ncbi:SMP-30/gluconolactonase/LRE family protein [Spirillospora sp. CA-108201]